MRRFDDKVGLVTGASAGIGRATVERLASEGASLFCVDVQAETLEHTAKAAAEVGVEVQAQVCDVSDARQVSATVSPGVAIYAGRSMRL